MTIEQLIPDLARLLGVEPSTALLVVGILVSIANLAGRLIPDDATGCLGTIRKIAKIIGLYVPNTITAGVTVNQVAKEVLLHEEEEEVIPPKPVAFPGLVRNEDEVERIIASTLERTKRGH